jgi:hypothetical protein
MKQERKERSSNKRAPSLAKNQSATFIELMTPLGQNAGRTGLTGGTSNGAPVANGHVEPAFGRFEIVGVNGRRVIVDGGVDAGSLLRIMRCVEELR